MPVRVLPGRMQHRWAYFERRRDFDCLFKFRDRKFSVGNLYISKNMEQLYQWQFIHKH